jgi:hypothetical protein
MARRLPSLSVIGVPTSQKGPLGSIPTIQGVRWL